MIPALASLALIAALMGTLRLSRKYSLPPLIEKTERLTETLPGNTSPITRSIEETVRHGDGGHFYYYYIEFSFTEPKRETERYVISQCHPSDEVSEFTYCTYGWPAWWQRLILSNHPYQNHHMLFPAAWLNDDIPHEEIVS